MSVSVAIATYKRSVMVRQAVEAALAQTLPPLEIVVTDDASPDDTWPVLTELATQHPQVRVFRGEINSGGVENWNYAIQQTTGDYIAWCSDDDRFLPGHLEASAAYLNSHPEVGLVHSGFVDALETETETRVEPRPHRFAVPAVLDRGGLFTYMVRYYDWPFHPSTIVMRREVWNVVGPFDPHWALADTDWFVRVVERFPVAMLPVHGVMNRRHPGNWSNAVGSARMQREIFEIVEGSIARLYANPVERVLRRMVWRNTVRLRLLLTLRQRAKTGHAEAACAAWETILRHTGLTVPSVMERAGSALLRWWCRRKQPKFETARQSVSPL
jgi:glycosyltransferase involved in cell wall biosynthesis